MANKRPKFLLDPFKPFGLGSPLVGLDNLMFRKLVREEFNEPHIDFFETPKEAVVTAELPGVKKEDVTVKVAENGLTLTVHQKEKHEHETRQKGNYEYSYSSRFQGYSRYIPFSSKVLANKAKATYKNGVLEVRAPKAAPGREEKQKHVKID